MVYWRTTPSVSGLCHYLDMCIRCERHPCSWGRGCSAKTRVLGPQTSGIGFILGFNPSSSVKVVSFVMSTLPSEIIWLSLFLNVPSSYTTKCQFDTSLCVCVCVWRLFTARDGIDLLEVFTQQKTPNSPCITQFYSPTVCPVPPPVCWPVDESILS